MATTRWSPNCKGRQEYPHYGWNNRLVMVALIGFIIALLGTLSSHAGAAANLNSLFYEANNYYANGNFAEAAQTYEEILQAGYTSGNLYYNLANAYYRNGQQGLALVNYLRAKRLIPRDPDLRANLEHVLKELEVPEESRGLVQWLSAKVTDWLTLRELAVLATVSFTLLTLTILLWLYLPAWKRWFKLISVVAGFCFILVLGGTAIASLANSSNHAVVVVREAVVRFEPTANGATHYTLREGSSAVIEDNREGWVQIRRADGKKGWVMAEEVRGVKNAGQ